MNTRLYIRAGLLVIIALCLNFQNALAHESITVGDYTLEVGWLSEPPVVGVQNAIVLHVSKTSDRQPVKDVSGLAITVSYGGQEKTLTLQPLGEDTPGQFVAPILPTVPGQYTLKLGGTLGDASVSTQVEPEEVQPADTLQFPSVANGNSTQQNAGSGVMSWLVYLSLLLGLVALGLAVVALRRAH